MSSTHTHTDRYPHHTHSRGLDWLRAVVVVTRHPGAVRWLASNLMPYHHAAVVTAAGLEYWPVGVEPGDGGDQPYAVVPVRDTVTADDVRGRHVVGNLPLHLAAVAASVTVIEFTGTPPRGQEYTAADMDAAGAVLRTYAVTAG